MGSLILRKAACPYLEEIIACLTIYLVGRVHPTAIFSGAVYSCADLFCPCFWYFYEQIQCGPFIIHFIITQIWILHSDVVAIKNLPCILTK